MAPAKVLQGAVRLPGFASSPTPDTQVRVAWAMANILAADRHITGMERRIKCVFMFFILQKVSWFKRKIIIILFRMDSKGLFTGVIAVLPTENTGY
jgi:hypothetical protein